MVVYCKSIKGYNNFSDTFKIGLKIKIKNIFSSIVFNKNNVNAENHTIYYGVTISKKLIKRAIIRNKVKRLLRESIRLLLKEFEITDLIFLDRVILSWQIVVNHPKEISLNDVMPSVKLIFERALNIYKKKNNITTKK